MFLRIPLEKVVDYTFRQIGEIRQGGCAQFFSEKLNGGP